MKRFTNFAIILQKKYINNQNQNSILNKSIFQNIL